MAEVVVVPTAPAVYPARPAEKKTRWEIFAVVILMIILGIGLVYVYYSKYAEDCSGKRLPWWWICSPFLPEIPLLYTKNCCKCYGIFGGVSDKYECGHPH
jgi:hypothetical protein